MRRDLERVLIDRERIAARVGELGETIAADITRDCELDHHDPDRLVLIPILTGSLVFVADLIRHLPFKLKLELIGISSYPGKSVESKGASLRTELPPTLTGRHILVVDDILDSGHTLEVVTAIINEQKPASLRTCVLLRKPGKAAFVPNYVGFDIPDEFVVGYGLDYDGRYRNYPEIATLRAEAR